jgi:hypothetical protein
MTQWEQSWASDVLAAFTSDEAPGLRPLPGEVDYLNTFRRMARCSTALAAFGLRAALWMVSFAPVWLLGRIGTFSSLSRRERTELLRRLLGHRSFAVRELTLLLKLTAAMALFASGSVRARSGYDDMQVVEAAPSAARPQHFHLPLVAASGEREPSHSQRPAAS